MRAQSYLGVKCAQSRQRTKNPKSKNTYCVFLCLMLKPPSDWHRSPAFWHSPAPHYLELVCSLYTSCTLTSLTGTEPLASRPLLSAPAGMELSGIAYSKASWCLQSEVTRLVLWETGCWEGTRWVHLMRMQERRGLGSLSPQQVGCGLA